MSRRRLMVGGKLEFVDYIEMYEGEFIYLDIAPNPYHKYEFNFEFDMNSSTGKLYGAFGARDRLRNKAFYVYAYDKTSNGCDIALDNNITQGLRYDFFRLQNNISFYRGELRSNEALIGSIAFSTNVTTLKMVFGGFVSGNQGGIAAISGTRRGGYFIEKDANGNIVNEFRAALLGGKRGFQNITTNKFHRVTKVVPVYE